MKNTQSLLPASDATEDDAEGNTAQMLSLLIPLTVVGGSGMAISYATLIDVANTNGLPLPELFPILIDVGTVACLVAADQFARLQIKGRWLATTTFAGLSALSVFANATHAATHADLAHTQVWIACVLAATPPAAMIAITHLWMQCRAKRRTQPKQSQIVADAASGPGPVLVLSEVTVNSSRREAPNLAVVATGLTIEDLPNGSSTTGIATQAERISAPTIVVESDLTVQSWITEEIAAGRKPTGAEVGRRLGKSARAGQRVIASRRLDVIG